MRNTFGPTQFRRQALHSLVLATLMFFGSVSIVIGQTEITGEDMSTPPAVAPLPNIYCFSGSPLLLQVNVPDPGQMLESISIESATSSFSYSIPPEPDRDALQLYINPFLSPGLYELEVTLRTRSGAEGQSRLDVGFVDFVWGRDNLNFGNNNKYVSVIGSFGEILAEWLNARFGEVDDADVVLLVDYMYGLFGKNTGRCYAFSGTEVRYWRWPELLPSYYDSAHDLRGNASRYQREMNFLQFDIVFDHFFAGPGAEQVQNAMNIDQIEAQVAVIESKIAAGEPVAVGFAGPDLHHSMLVFGFIRNHTTNTVDLLVANNWKNDEKLNIHSRDSEIIRLSLAPDHEGPIGQWRYEDGVRKREIDRLFVVDVRRDPYVHELALLDTLSVELRKQLDTEGRTVVVVEDAAGARVVDGDHSTGWIGSRITEELEEVWFERVGKSYRFTCPADAAFELEIADTGGARVLIAAPGLEPGVIIPSIHVTEATEDGETVTRRFPLPAVTHH
jgi:hypothetical protein